MLDSALINIDVERKQKTYQNLSLLRQTIYKFWSIYVFMETEETVL